MKEEKILKITVINISKYNSKATFSESPFLLMYIFMETIAARYELK